MTNKNKQSEEVIEFWELAGNYHDFDNVKEYVAYLRERAIDSNGEYDVHSDFSCFAGQVGHFSRQIQTLLNQGVDKTLTYKTLYETAFLGVKWFKEYGEKMPGNEYYLIRMNKILGKS